MRGRKGFTLVELVIVIAVIVILAAVLIPTFSGVIEKANNAKDFSLVSEMNKVLALEEATDGKNETMHDAALVLEEYGMDIEKLPSSKGYIYVWNSKENRVAALNKDYKLVFPQGEEINDSNKENYFAVAKTEEEINNLYSLGYSVYLKESATVTTVNATQGFDAGNNTTAISVSYTNSGTQAKDVVIRTNGGTLTVNAPQDEVAHYGYADSVEIIAVKNASYSEHGTVPFLEIAKGHIVLESDSNVSHLHFDKKADENSFDTIKVTKASSVELPTFSRDSIGTSLKDPVLVVEFATEGAAQSEYVWLVETGVYEKMAVTNSSATPTETTQNVENASATAKAIANQIANAVGENDTVTDGGVDKEATKSAAIDNYYNEEESPVNIPLGTYAYYSNDGKLVTIKEDGNFFDSLPDGVTVTICKDITLGDTEVTIENKSLTIKGVSGNRPIVKGHFVIKNDGNDKIEFKHLEIRATIQGKAIIFDKSTCSRLTDLNILTVDDCKLFTTLKKDSDTGNTIAIALGHTSNVVGTKLVATNNIFETDSYSQSNGKGCLTASISSNTNVSGEYTTDVYSIDKHVIKGNTFRGNIYYAYIGGYADFVDNEVDFYHYDENGNIVTDAGRAFQIRGSYTINSKGAQCELTVKGNTFKNMEQLFKFYTLDRTDFSKIALDIRGTSDAEPNKFENISSLGEADGNSTKTLTEYIEYFSSKQWGGINGAYVTIAMDKINMSLEGTLETGYMTLSNGTQVMTYTQAVNPADGRRTGYSLTDAAGNKYWYYAQFNDNINYFIKDGTNEFYVAILGGGGDCESLKVKDTSNGWPKNDNGTNEPDWATDNTVKAALTKKTFKYLDGKGDSKVGALYKSGFSIATDNFGNTYFNASVSQENNVVTLTQAGNGVMNIAVSNIGSYSKVAFVSEAGSDANTLYVVYTGEKLGQITLNVPCDAEIGVNVDNMLVYKKAKVTIDAGKSVNGILKITKESAKETTLINNGTIGKLYIHAKTTLTNNGTITTVAVGDILPGGIDARIRTCRDAKGTIITNYGSITTIHSLVTITLTNETTGHINSLAISFLNNDAMQYTGGSIVVNNGFMCDSVPGGNIEIYSSCNFTNTGTIGVAGRGTQSSHDPCDKVGGMIVIGYWGYSNAHDGTVFTNTGTIYAGARHNETAHQQVTFWICGTTSGNPVTITVINSGTIHGKNTIPSYGVDANHNVPASWNN